MKPRYQLLSQAELEQIHETTLRVMEEVGVVFSYDPARELLAKHGARVEGHTVFFPRALVEERLKTVPSSFTLHARNPEKSVVMNTEDTYYAGPNCPPYIQDLDNGRRYATLDDFINIVKLVNDLSNVDIQSQIPCESNDVETDMRPVMMTYIMLKYSDKPLMGSSLGYEFSKKSIEMAAIANGGLDVLEEKTVIAAIPCTLTPLSYDDKMAGAIFAYAETNQAQLVNSLPIAGATSPAEMSTGSLSIGSPENAIFSLINGQLAKFYNIPCRISGSLSDSKMVDSQSAFEAAITGMMGELAGGNFVLHGVGIIESYNCVFLEKLIIDNELIGYFKHIAKGVEINEDTLAFDAIKEVGPQGEFLSNMHTFQHFRKTFYRPFLSNRQNTEHWKADGCISLEQAANAKWKQMLAEYEEPALPGDVEKDLRKYIEK